MPQAGEYDVPQCKPGTPPSQCVYTTTSAFTVRDSMRKCSSMSDVWCAPGWNESSDVLLLRAGTHCHAPASDFCLFGPRRPISSGFF
jgi:hypothetical protein